MATDTTGGYCPKHDKHYSKLEQCSACRAERAGAVVAGSPKADTSPMRVRAAEYRLREYSLWQASASLISKDPHVAVKLSDQAGKWAGRSDELEHRLLEIEHHQWMLEEDKRRRGGS